jgi:hypothetical protein
MTTVQRFQLDVSDQAEVEMPKGAQILGAGVMKSRPCIWALVNEHSPPVRRRLRLTATGEPISDHHAEWKYVGSVILGSNDCHLWDLGELPNPA